jgi:arsenite methyltransferase
MEADKIKDAVKEKYGQIAVQSDKESGCGCGCGCSGEQDISWSIMNDEYSKMEGYYKDADLQLGCGLPTEFADIKKGDTVVDLGSGAGNDVFVARTIAGDEGKVIGIDFTNEMIEKANNNNAKLGYKNVEFRFGDIESLPLEENTVDVVISNCVLNLVPDKVKAFSEINRILKPGGHFCVSDIVTKGGLSDELRNNMALYAGCISGALEQDEYIDVIKQTGFKNIEIKKSKVVPIPESILKDYLKNNDPDDLKEGRKGIFSITVTGYKN